MNFPEREQMIKSVQRFLGLKEDSDDGFKTWSAIVAKLGIKTSTISTIPSLSKYPEEKKLSKQTNGTYSQKIKPEALVLHHTSGSFLGSVDWCSRVYDDNGNRLYASYHCIIARDGRRVILNEDDNRAYHAGASSFKGRSSLNGWSIGVSFEGDTNTHPLEKEAIESALEYIIPRMKKWGLTIDDVTDHRIVATPKGRKNDLAPKEYDKMIAAIKAAL